MRLRSIEKVKDLKGKRVLVRVDFNVPTERGRVHADGEWRLRQTIPTIGFLMGAGAKVILMSHRGRPNGKKVLSLRMAPVAKRFSAMIGKTVKSLPDCIGPTIEKEIAKMKNGEVVLLENLRFKAGESKNDAKFAKKLAALADVYVNDAFATSHRKAASIVAITKELPSYAGLLLIKEVEALEHAMKKAEKPFIVIMGGAKVSTKIGAIENLMKVADRILLGGALLIPFLEVQGFGIGKSDIEKEDIDAALRLIHSKDFKKIVLPIDVLVGDPKRPEDRLKTVDLTEDPFELGEKQGHSILDIGPKTISAYASFLRSAKTIVWNGPLGLFEIPKYSHGTLSLGRLIAARSKGRAFGLVGGGETVMALEKTGLADCVDHISTGGGSMLEFIEGKDLPGLKALTKK